DGPRPARRRAASPDVLLVRPFHPGLHLLDLNPLPLQGDMTMARMTKAQKLAEKAKREARLAENRRIVQAGACPVCGRPLRRNLAVTGWWQCSQYGAVGFRVDAESPSCSFQTFTD